MKLGMSKRALDSRRFARPFRGVRVPRTLLQSIDRNATQQLVTRDAALLLPILSRDDVIGGPTALQILGAPIRVTGSIHLYTERPNHRIRLSGVASHQRCAEPKFDHDVKVKSPFVGGPQIPVVSYAEAVLQSANLLKFRELVVALDFAILPQRLRPNGSQALERDQLVAMTETYSGRGIRRLRAALHVARAGAQSRMETLLRLEAHRLGHHDLELQADIHDDSGVWIGRFDLVDRERRQILEYDGEQHRTNRSQYLKDLHRLDRVREAGWHVTRFHMEDFWPQNLSKTSTRVFRCLGGNGSRLSRELKHYFDES